MSRKYLVTCDTCGDEIPWNGLRIEEKRVTTMGAGKTNLTSLYEFCNYRCMAAWATKKWEERNANQ